MPGNGQSRKSFSHTKTFMAASPMVGRHGSSTNGKNRTISIRTDVIGVGVGESSQGAGRQQSFRARTPAHCDRSKSQLRFTVGSGSQNPGIHDESAPHVKEAAAACGGLRQECPGSPRQRYPTGHRFLILPRYCSSQTMLQLMRPPPNNNGSSSGTAIFTPL